MYQHKIEMTRILVKKMSPSLKYNEDETQVFFFSKPPNDYFCKVAVAP